MVLSVTTGCRSVPNVGREQVESPIDCKPKGIKLSVENNRLTLSVRTRLLNCGRSLLKVPPAEGLLAKYIRQRPLRSRFARKLVPNNYQYPPGSLRSFSHFGLRWRVDISDYIGHCAYFGLDQSMQALFELCSCDSVVFDVGVNIGWTALHMSRICSAGRVYGFEPDPYNFAACRRNMDLNELANLKVSPIALGAEPGSVQMEIPTLSNRGGNRIAQQGSINQRGDIPMVTADEFARISEVDRLDVIKIDTEGFELRVLTGARGLLLKYRPTLFVEINDANLKMQGDSALELLNFIRSAGYSKIVAAHSREEVSEDNLDGFGHFDIIAR